MSLNNRVAYVPITKNGVTLFAAVMLQGYCRHEPRPPEPEPTVGYRWGEGPWAHIEVGWTDPASDPTSRPRTSGPPTRPPR